MKEAVSVRRPGPGQERRPGHQPDLHGCLGHHALYDELDRDRIPERHSQLRERAPGSVTRRVGPSPTPVMSRCSPTWCAPTATTTPGGGRLRRRRSDKGAGSRPPVHGGHPSRPALPPTRGPGCCRQCHGRLGSGQRGRHRRYCAGCVCSWKTPLSMYSWKSASGSSTTRRSPVDNNPSPTSGPESSVRTRPNSGHRHPGPRPFRVF